MAVLSVSPSSVPAFLVPWPGLNPCLSLVLLWVRKRQKIVGDRQTYLHWRSRAPSCSQDTNRERRPIDLQWKIGLWVACYSCSLSQREKHLFYFAVPVISTRDGTEALENAREMLFHCATPSIPKSTYFKMKQLFHQRVNPISALECSTRVVTILLPEGEVKSGRRGSEPGAVLLYLISYVFCIVLVFTWSYVFIGLFVPSVFYHFHISSMGVENFWFSF